jgi:hypothetical protein
MPGFSQGKSYLLPLWLATEFNTADIIVNKDSGEHFRARLVAALRACRRADPGLLAALTLGSNSTEELMRVVSMRVANDINAPSDAAVEALK